MKFGVDSRLVTVFGSEARVRTLAVLANARRPITAYRVGIVGGVSMPKVYSEISRLSNAGLLERRRNGWVLVDEDIRRLMQRRVRISWSEDWLEGERERARRAERIIAEPDLWFDISKYRSNSSIAAQYAKEFRRPPEKGPSRKHS